MVREDCRLKIVVTKDIHHNPHRCDGSNSRLVDTEETQEGGGKRGSERTQLCETLSHAHKMIVIILYSGDTGSRKNAIV